jgi:hypothetical protein
MFSLILGMPLVGPAIALVGSLSVTCDTKASAMLDLLLGPNLLFRKFSEN